MNYFSAHIGGSGRILLQQVTMKSLGIPVFLGVILPREDAAELRRLSAWFRNRAVPELQGKGAERVFLLGEECASQMPEGTCFALCAGENAYLCSAEDQVLCQILSVFGRTRLTGLTGAGQGERLSIVLSPGNQLLLCPQRWTLDRKIRERIAEGAVPDVEEELEAFLRELSAAGAPEDAGGAAPECAILLVVR